MPKSSGGVERGDGRITRVSPGADQPWAKINDSNGFSRNPLPPGLPDALTYHVRTAFSPSHVCAACALKPFVPAARIRKTNAAYGGRNRELFIHSSNANHASAGCGMVIRHRTKSTERRLS